MDVGDGTSRSLSVTTSQEGTVLHKEGAVITVVSGLPRSGTSMMMQMLEAGGMEVLVDHVRKADADNLKGYYEFERVKQLDKGDHAWLTDAVGKAVKIISALLVHLPPHYLFRIIFMRRKMEEVLDSQQQMLMRRGEALEGPSDDHIGKLFRKHLKEVESWIEQAPNVSSLNVDYNKLLQEPLSQLESVNRFLGGVLQVDNMVSILDPRLYRQRR